MHLPLDFPMCIVTCISFLNVLLIPFSCFPTEVYIVCNPYWLSIMAKYALFSVIIMIFLIAIHLPAWFIVLLNVKQL